MVAFVSSLVFSALSLSALAIPVRICDDLPAHMCWFARVIQMPDAGAKSFTKQNGEAAIILKYVRDYLATVSHLT